ncbi:MAG: undecaprenyl-diphosphatase UppP [Dehalococcoidia bacterium]
MALDLLKAAILGIVQGLTEFLPVSSTGHLILVEKLLRVDQDRYGLSFDAALHLGTLAALLVYFGRSWLELIAGWFRTIAQRSLADPDGRIAWLIILGTIPAAAIGFVFESQVEHAFRKPALVGAMLIAFSAVFFLAEAAGRRTRSRAGLTPVDALLIGGAQAIALVPGVSRSGATISMGLFRNFERVEAASFAFLLSAPIIAGAGLKKAYDVVGEFRDGTLGGADAAFFAVGAACAAIVGYISIAFLLRFLSTNSLRPFAYYRIALGVGVLAVVGGQALF